MKGDFHISKQQVALPCVPHRHNFLEVAYISRGWVMHAVGHARRRLDVGDFVWIDFGEAHGYETGSDDLEIVNCLFQPAMIDLSLRNSRCFSDLLSGCVLGIGYCASGAEGGIRRLHDASGRIWRILGAMIEETEQKKMGYYVILRLLVTALVVEIARMAEVPAQYRPGVELSWMMEEIRRHVNQPHSLEAYAAQFHMRPETLGKQFYQQTGERFLHYIRRRRVEMACRLLLETTLPIAAIAERCGYQDEKSFRGAFREIVGMVPAAYRRQYRPAAR